MIDEQEFFIREEWDGDDCGYEFSSERDHRAVRFVRADRLEEAERHAESIADAVGFPAHNDNRRKTSVITHCIENMRRFSDYLHAIEQEFFMTPGEPDDDYPDEEPDPECLVNSWGARSRDHYVEQFRGAFARLKAQWQAEALEGVLAEHERKGVLRWAFHLERRANELRRQTSGEST